MRISVITFNTASPWGSREKGTSSQERIGKFIRYMKEENADLIGTQELNYFWADEMQKQLDEYAFYGVVRGGDDSEWTSEMNGVFYKKNKFEKLFEKTFWLSKTPNISSRFVALDENGNKEQANCYRICSYVILKAENGELLAFLNTHLDHICESAMIWGAQLILSEIDEIKEKYGKDINIVLSGDFNQKEDSAVYRLLSSKLNDTTDETKKRATYQNWGADCEQNGGWAPLRPGETPIDFIFTNGKGVEYRILDKKDNGYISDHFGIFVSIDF